MAATAGKISCQLWCPGEDQESCSGCQSLDGNTRWQEPCDLPSKRFATRLSGDPAKAGQGQSQRPIRDSKDQVKRIKFSPAFNRDWDFFMKNRPLVPFVSKWSFAGERVTWEADETLEPLPAKEAFYTFDSAGKRHPCTELDILLSIITFKKSLNFHIKMWVEGYNWCGQGVDVYLAEFIDPPEWVGESFRNQLHKSIRFAP